MPTTRLFATAVVVVPLLVIVATGSAAPNPSGTGQPSQTCPSSTAPSEPGRAASAPGSAFNETMPAASTRGPIPKRIRRPPDSLYARARAG